MIQLNDELKKLKTDILEMWALVINQVAYARESLENFDKSLIKVIKNNEKKIDAFELKIDMDCENIFALFNPVANDLRFVLACLKINYNLERIGDFAYGIAKGLNDLNEPFDKDSINKTKLFEIFNITIFMLSEAFKAFDLEDNKLARMIYKNDDPIDQINKNLNYTISELIKNNSEKLPDYLILFTNIKKLERIGDHTKNIADEIIFYLEAKVLKHNKKER
jgi:phosphate transport system protein